MRVWCGIIFCGGIGTEGSGNYELIGEGVGSGGPYGAVIGEGS